MKSPFTSAAIMGLAFLSFTAIADARRGLDADELHLLTRGTDYTFHSICADFKNPDLFFDEWELARTIQAITNDLNMYMWGSSSSSPSSSSPHTTLNETPLRHQTARRYDKNTRELDKGRDRGGGGKGGKGKKIDCRNFERDLRDFSTSFQKMVYAISEQCYRQCEPNGYVAYAAANLQTTFEAHYNGGFYRQIREIEAETGCRFADTFLIEPERAIDYSKIWIETFQRGERPCARLGR